MEHDILAIETKLREMKPWLEAYTEDEIIDKLQRLSRPGQEGHAQWSLILTAALDNFDRLESSIDAAVAWHS